MSFADTTIAVDPSSLLGAAQLERLHASTLRSIAPTTLDTDAVGDPASAAALRKAVSTLAAAVLACSDGADDLSAALIRAHGAYALSESSAVPR